MSISASGESPYPFRWYYKPDIIKYQDPVPVVQVIEPFEPVPFEELPSLLKEIDNRHWGAIRQILIEAKLKAEAQLRSDEVIANPQLCAAYQGWVNYADYILGNMEGLRSGMLASEQRL
jgi:hypothetical protein